MDCLPCSSHCDTQMEEKVWREEGEGKKEDAEENKGEKRLEKLADHDLQLAI